MTHHISKWTMSAKVGHSVSGKVGHSCRLTWDAFEWFYCIELNLFVFCCNMTGRKKQSEDQAKKYGVQNLGDLVKAIKEIKVEKKLVRAVAKAYSIPKTSLFRYISKLDEQISDIALIDDDELTDKICKLTSHGSPTVCIRVIFG